MVGVLTGLTALVQERTGQAYLGRVFATFYGGFNGLMALGIEPEQRVGIASGTRYDWILADLAVTCAGAATTTTVGRSVPAGRRFEPSGPGPASASGSSPR